MADKDGHPLPSTCIKNLQDKLYDKRKVGALEVEKMIREYCVNSNFTEIETLLTILGNDFAGSPNPNNRKGGLIALAAACIGLEKLSHHYCPLIITPVIRCLYDLDSRVRYYACESLYNIVKMTKVESLNYFNDMFDALSKCIGDPDASVRKGSEQLDRIVKEVVMENPSFDITSLIPLLRERVYTKNSFARQFIISWVSTLDTVPDINMITYLPDLLDGLFQILTDTNPQIREKCEDLFSELLGGFAKLPDEEVNYAAMVNILIAQCQFSEFCNVQLTALIWLQEFFVHSSEVMLRYTSGILAAVLPCLAYKDKQRLKLKETAGKLNDALMNLVKVEIVVQEDSFLDPNSARSLSISSTLEVVCRLAGHECEMTRLASIRWMDALFNNSPEKVFRHAEDIIPILHRSLLDTSIAVIRCALSVMVQLCSHPAGTTALASLSPQLLEIPECLDRVLSPATNHYLRRFLLDLMRMFDNRPKMLAERADLIVTYLCSNLGAEKVYPILCQIIIHVDTIQTSFTLVQVFNRILLTQDALFDFRNKLRAINTKESCFLFQCLYEAWSHNVVALISLCLLTQNYEHSSVLMRGFGELEITLNTLTEFDQLIQFLESPIFAFLRLHLIDPRHSVHLQETLYSLLMCLPQTEAFHVLHRRLDCVPRHPLKQTQVHMALEEPDWDLINKHINFDQLLTHFREVQEHLRTKRLASWREKQLGLKLSTPGNKPS